MTNLSASDLRRTARRLVGRSRWFWHAPRALKGLLLQLPLLIGGVRLMLEVLPFGRLLRLVHRWAEAPATLPEGALPEGALPEGTLPPQTVAWAVNAVGRRLMPERPCLTLALVGLVLLRRRGYDAHLRIGVKRTGVKCTGAAGGAEKGGFRAHAWIESGGCVLIGQLADLESFSPLPPVREEPVLPKAQ